MDDVWIECLVIYIGEERCSKLVPNCVISCIHSIYFPKVPQGKNIQCVDGVVPPPQFALFIPNWVIFLCPLCSLCVCVLLWKFDGFFLWKIERMICGNLVDPLMGGVGFACRFASSAITFYVPNTSFYFRSFLFVQWVHFLCINMMTNKRTIITQRNHFNIIENKTA